MVETFIESVAFTCFVEDMNSRVQQADTSDHPLRDQWRIWADFLAWADGKENDPMWSQLAHVVELKLITNYPEHVAMPSWIDPKPFNDPIARVKMRTAIQGEPDLAHDEDFDQRRYELLDSLYSEVLAAPVIQLPLGIRDAAWNIVRYELLEDK